jgi:anti-anti-sigma regulatory factor
MTLKITLSGPGPAPVLTLDGRLTGHEVAELHRAVAEAGGRVVLDLTGLQFADRLGVTALRELKAHGVSYTGASPYIGHLIGEAPLDAAN